MDLYEKKMDIRSLREADFISGCVCYVRLNYFYIGVANELTTG